MCKKEAIKYILKANHHINGLFIKLEKFWIYPNYASF